MLRTHDFHLSIAHKKICQNLELVISPGDIWGILGPNGSGKTTLLHALAGLHAFQGDLWLFEKSMRVLSKKKIATLLGILLQDTLPTFPQTVFEYCMAGRHPHLSYFARETQEDYRIVHQALQTMDLVGISQQNIVTLSGGERRRLAIAALIAQNPQIYLLDEPTNHLDVKYQVKVLTYFKKMAESHATAVIMTLHDLNIAQQYCNKILMLLGKGEVLFGNTAEMLTIANISRLYQHPFCQIRDVAMWQPIGEISCRSESW